MSQKIMKTVTFSYDDGVTQDQRLVDLFNKYDLKCTFNLNSSLGGTCKLHKRNGTTFTHARFDTDEYQRVYKGHEVAVHTLTHPHMANLTDEEIIREVEQDRLVLSELGMSLGKYDVSEQREAIRHTVERLERHSVEAAAEKERDSKIHAAVSVTAGILAVILLL